MRKLWWVLVIAALVVALSPNALAQCAEGEVRLQGKVQNLTPGTSADVVVVLKTSKGDFTNTAAVVEGRFGVNVGFSTLKSWSPLWGHRCSNAPKIVEVTVRHANQVLVQEELKFNESFETRDSLVYTFKGELMLDVSTKAVPGNGL